MGFIALLYGLVCYLVFLASLLYAIGFVGNLVVPKGIDSGVEGPLAQALVTNIGLMLLFAVQHSIMARRWFKKWWAKIVPVSVERSTFVLIASLLLFLLYWKWQPITTTVWNVESSAGRTVIWAVFVLAWLGVVVVSFLIDHFSNFGLRQVWSRFRGKEFVPDPFKKPLAYKVVRHPLNLCFLIAFWATPHMTQGHLLFALVITVFVVVATRWEEQDLVDVHGADYEQYQRDVGRFIPRPGSKA